MRILMTRRMKKPGRKCKNKTKMISNLTETFKNNSIISVNMSSKLSNTCSEEVKYSRSSRGMRKPISAMPKSFPSQWYLEEMMT